MDTSMEGVPPWDGFVEACVRVRGIPEELQFFREVSRQETTLMVEDGTRQKFNIIYMGQQQGSPEGFVRASVEELTHGDKPHSVDLRHLLRTACTQGGARAYRPRMNSDVDRKVQAMIVDQHGQTFRIEVVERPKSDSREAVGEMVREQTREQMALLDVERVSFHTSR